MILQIIKKSILFLLTLILLMACRGHKNTSASPSESDKKSKKEKKKKESSSSKKADVIIKTARGYTGTPYRFGGTTKAGIDCSGLSCASYKAADITLPRTAKEQSIFGKTIKLSEIEKGDLVFFSDKKNSKTITHVGIITEVRGSDSAKFIHASTKAGVVEVELFSDYYKPLIVKVARVLE